jgi:hypothetical protein
VRGRGARSEPLAAVSSHDVKQRSLLRSRAAFVRRGWSPSFASIPRTRGWRSADRRTLLLCRACEARRPRERNAGRPVATGTPSRRSVVAIFGRGPVLPPPAVAPEPMSTCPRQALRPDGRGPGPPALRFAPQSRDATPRSIVRIVSGDAPSERGWQTYTIASCRSQDKNSFRSQLYGARQTQHGLILRSGRPGTVSIASTRSARRA